MKKCFLQRYRDFEYVISDANSTQNFCLEFLFWVVDGNRDWIYVTLENDHVLIWSSWYLKPKAQQAFEDAYRIYYHKRWLDMPKLTITKKNYELVLLQWAQIEKTLPLYVIISQDDLGMVNIIGKDELSEQDRADMKKEHEKFLRYQVAWRNYMDSLNAPRSNIWRSPADDEYEADFKPFFDEN